MKRQLTAREKILLALLGVILVVCAYYLLFYTPMTAERERCISEAETCRMQTEAAGLRLEEKRRMERELDVIFSAETPPLGIADYDNLKPVMFELNTILAGAGDYSLSFGTVDASQTIVRRSISMSFNTAGYESARAILQQLHDSAYRCMLDGLNLQLDQESGVSVNGTIVFFEYQAQPKEPES